MSARRLRAGEVPTQASIILCFYEENFRRCGEKKLPRSVLSPAGPSLPHAQGQEGKALDLLAVQDQSEWLTTRPEAKKKAASQAALKVGLGKP